MEIFSSLGARFGSLVLALALLYVAHKAHRSRGRIPPQVTQTIGVILAFAAGLAFLVTFIGDWASNLANSVPWLPAAAFLVLSAIIVFDWLNDGRPDKAAFVAMLLLPLVVVLGLGQLSALWDQIGDGAGQVGDQIGQVGADQ